MIKIREVTISGNEYFLDTIIGYDGEHKITNLNIKLPSELISDDIDHYTVEFQTQNGDVISSGNIQQNGGYVVVSPWQDVMVFGQLKFQVTAWAMTGDTIDKIAKSPVITRLVGESVDGDAVLLDENVDGLMVELQQLIANYPVMMGTFTAGEEWDFELVDGLLNIVYVPATDGEDGLNETVEKFSDLPENGTIAIVQNDEVITQAQSDFKADREYSLFVNPQIPLDVDFEVALIQSESEFDNGAISLALNTTELSHPVFAIVTKITDGEVETSKMWYYAENDIISETLTILKGWSAVEVVDDVVTKNESISYTDLPNLYGTFVEANSLGGTYFSEMPYNLNKAGLYEFNGSWKRVDNDKSLWCESTGYFSTANGYGTTASGTATTANGYGTTASAIAATANGYGTTASGTVATANGIRTTASALAATANGYITTASGDASTANGISTTASAIASTANGRSTMASGDAATANGSNTTASGDAATANGYGTNASAYAATANGSNTTASATAAASFGSYTNAKHVNSTIVGKFGETDTDTLFAVANGTSIANKSLALNIAFTQATWTIPVIGLTASSGDNSTKFATTAFVQGEISTKELKSNKVTTIDANSTDDEYPSAKAVFDFVPEIDVDELVPTMTEYDADDGLTLNKGNYWTTTGSIAFALPTAVSGKENTFKLFVKVTDAGHAVTFSPSGSQRLGAVAHTFGVGTHLVEGVYNPIDSKWLLGCSAVGVPA